MLEDFNQKISQFLDNELDDVHALSLLKKMQMQPELQDKLNRYEAISHAMKTDAFLLTKADFSTKIRQKVQQEPLYLLPQHKTFKRSHKQIALAASIAIVAVIAGRSSMNHQGQQPKSASVIQLAQQQAPQQSAQPAVNANVDTNKAPLNKRINDYLQAHNSSVYKNGESTVQPFTRVTAYNQK